MGRLGLDYETIERRNPRIVYCSISGYGSEGPLAGRAGFDPVIQAESGLMALTGEPDGPPMRLGVALVDAMTGSTAAESILAALFARERTGRGQRVEVALFDTGINMLVNFAAAYLMAGVIPPRAGNSNLVSQPVGVYEAADGPFLLTVGNDRGFQRFCREVLEAPAILDDPRFATTPDRLTNVTALNEVLAPHLHARPRQEWIERLRAAGIPAAEIRTLDEALDSEEVRLRGLRAEVHQPGVGRLETLRSPMRLGQTPCRDPGPAPRLGEHTERVLAEIAGYGPEDIERLRRAGAIRG
jgi:formyl-CoA transferase